MMGVTNRKGFLAQQNTFLDTIATRFDGTHSNFVLGNAQAGGSPIVYCSDGFCELTGFGRGQIMGKCCAGKFLYGEKTTDAEKAKIDDALESIKELKTEIMLYRKNGVAFLCLMDIIPIKNEKSQVVLFLVSHKDISKENLAEVAEKETSDESEGDDDYEENFQPPNVRCRADMPTNCNYQRRRSRAVLYHLSGQFERQNKAKSKLQKFNKLTESISGKMPEYKVQEVKKSRFIIAHYGLFKIGWDWLIMLCTFYTAIMVPYNAAFITMDGNYKTSVYSDVVVEILFIVDIVLNFRTSFVSKSGQVIYDGRMIAINYIRGWFVLDLLAAIPFDFLYTLDISTDTPVHLLKVARLLRLARLLQKIERYSQYSAIVLALLMLLFALVAHWLACIWYAIGYHELVKSKPTWTTGWLYELSERLDEPINANKTNKPALLTSYVTAFYFTCSSLTSVGFGNVSANTDTEKIFSVCAMLVGAMMHAVVFGNVTAIIQRMYSRRANYHSRTKDLKDFFRTHRIPKPLKHRMQEYFQTMWLMNNGMETGEILKDFPEEMRGEICQHLHKDLLSLAIFEDATQGCLKSISLQARRAFSAPGEFLVHKGDAINYVYLLCSGTMEVLKQELVVAILGKGDLFGADVNFEDPVGISCCDVRSLTYCELQGINIKGLVDVLSLYPDFAEKFAQDLRHDLTYNLKEGYEESDEEYEIKPIGRVMTLPSISEDDEETDSDKDHVFGKGDNSSSPGSHKDAYRESSPSSPLLSDKTFSFNLPNGDIESLNREITSPSTKRVVTPSKRSLTSNFRRSSVRDRKRNINNVKSDTDRNLGIETLSSSLQNLKTDFEGTKSNIFHIEKKVDHIGHELSTMDEKLKSLLEILTPNPSLHSQSPPNTPFSPYTKPHFSFGSPTSEEEVMNSPRSVHVGSNLDVPYTCTKKSCKSRDNVSLKPVMVTPSSSPNTGYSSLPKEKKTNKQRPNKSCDNLFQGDNEHQDLERRHSDDGPYRKCTIEQNGSAYKKTESPAMFEYLTDVDRLRIQPTDCVKSRNTDIPINEKCSTVHTISTGDCRKPSTIISRIPRSVVVQTQHSPNTKNILETTDL